MIKNKNVNILFFFIFTTILSWFLNYSSFWVGGDSIPNMFIFEFINSHHSFYSNTFGLTGPSNFIAFISYFPYIYFFKFISILNIKIDFIYIIMFLFITLYGYFNLFYKINKNYYVSFILSFLIIVHPYSWLMTFRNNIFLIILFSSCPWIILSIKNILEYKRAEVKNFKDRTKNFLPWVEFFFVILFASAGLMNPGYAIPVILFILFYIFVFVEWKSNRKRFLGITIIVLFFALPNVIGQINLLINSKALNDDYWNNIVLTKIPLDRHVTSNKIENIIRGYNWDTLTDYGYWEGQKYYPWWFAKYKDTQTSILLYIPIFLAILLGYLVLIDKNVKKKDKIKIIYLFGFLLCLIFMIKSSAGPGGQYFYDFMMNHGWFKMFRSPHLKFGVEYLLVLVILISFSLSILKNKYLEYLTIILLGVYVIVFGFYPIVTRQYIPPLQKIKAIPQEYYDLQKFLQKENKTKINETNKYNLGILLPSNDSTWDSLNWGQNGFYEGYHILHWMNTGTSFLNRNGLSFNARNLVGFNALMDLKDYKTDSIDVLKSEGYKIFVYDKSSDRETRFGIKENHLENIKWLDSQSDRLQRVWEEGNLIVYEIKNYEIEDLQKLEENIKNNSIIRPIVNPITIKRLQATSSQNGAIIATTTKNIQITPPVNIIENGIIEVRSVDFIVK